MKKIGFFTLFIFLVLPHFAVAQSTNYLELGEIAFKEKDYVKAYEIYSEAIATLSDSASEEEYVSLLELVSKSLTHQFRMDEALHYLERADSIAVQKKMTLKHLNLLTAKIALWNYLNEQDKIYDAAMEGLSYKDANLSFQSEFNQSLGHYYEFKGDNEKALFYHKKTYEIDKELKDSSSFPFSALAYGLTSSRAGENEKSLDLMLEGMSWLRGEKDKFKEASFYWRIQGVFLKQRNYIKAKEYGLKGAEVSDKYGMVMTRARILLGLYQVYLYEKDFDKALDALNTALATFLDKKAEDRVYNAYTGKAEVFLAMNELDSTAYYLNKALEYEVPDFTYDILLNNYVKAGLFIKQGKLQDAEKLLLDGLAIVEGKNRPYWEKDLVDKLSSISFQRNRLADAYQYLRRFESLKDSIYFLEQDRTIHELETKYQNAEQKQEIAELNILNERRKFINRMTFIGLIFSLIILGFIFWLYRINRRNRAILQIKNDEIAKALDEKELLLREIHHRVKNNLQVISSLLNLQTKFVEDDSALSALNEGKNRVKSMALIHQNLYQEDNLTGIEIKSYFEELCQTLFDSYNISEDQIHLKLDIQEINLDVDTVIPLGLIMNELITNALKYAFGAGENGIIEIELREENDKVYLSVKDDGKGMKEEDLSNSKSFGYKLIKAFLRKLDATIEFENSEGTHVSLIINNYKKVA